MSPSSLSGDSLLVGAALFQGDNLNRKPLKTWFAAAMTSALCFGLASTVKAEDEATSKNGIPNPSIATSLPKGEDSAVRAALADKGITYGVNYIGEIWSNTGGLDQSVLPGGRLEGVLDADLDKLFSLKGLTAHVNVYQYHGSGLSRENLENLFAVSSIEALPGARLFELYVEQQVNDIVSVRLGQMAVDSEFLISASGSTFINGTFGWAGSVAANLPSGGMAYPLATPGVRFKLEPTKNVTVLAAMFNGDPAGTDDEERDPQDRNASGLIFPVNDPPFFIQELQFKYNNDKNATGLPGTIKVGAWQHTGDFEHLRLDAGGVSTALSGNDPAFSAAISAFTSSPISKSTGLRAARPITECTSSAAFRQARKTAALSTSTRMAALSFTAPISPGPPTLSASPSPMRRSPTRPARSTGS